jgi:phenylacetate-CoA ligase
MARLSIIVPCLDEAASLPELVRRVSATCARLFPAPGDAELLLIDDGSTDDSWAVIERLTRDQPFVRGLRHPRRRGIPAAWQTGVTAARGALVCVLDADLQYEPEEIARLWELRLRTNVDVAQGARASLERGRDPRLFFSRGLNHLLNVGFAMSLHDNKSGFFLCARDDLARLLAARRSYRHWQCFVMVAAHHGGLSIAQIETPFHPRMAGRSAFGRWGLRAALAVARDLVTAARQYRGTPS